MRSRRPLALAAAVTLSIVANALPAAAVVYEFPPGFLGFHTYQEMVNETAAAAAAYPAIVKRFSIGRSYGGRDIWAVKISDNVATTSPSRKSSSTASTTATST